MCGLTRLQVDSAIRTGSVEAIYTIWTAPTSNGKQVVLVVVQELEVGHASD